MRITLKKGKIVEQEIDWEQEIYGRGYEKLDWERERRKTRDFWVALDEMSTGVALMFDWFWTFGSSVDVIRPFLKLTGEKTESFPCPAETPCGCRHTIGETRRDELIATCCCEWRCGTYELEPGDILFHGIDFERFGDAIRQALGFAKPSAAGYVSAGLREIGTYSAAAVPVYLSLESTDGLLRELTKLLGQRDGPFLVLTSTGGSWSAEVEALARPHAGGHISLSSVLNASPNGFASNGTVEPMLSEFAMRLNRGNGLAAVVQRIGSDLQVIAKGAADLRRENQELKEMQGAGLFQFALRVDVADFQAFAAVMALGNRKAAAEFLDVPMRTFYDRVEAWRMRGKDYQRMFRMVEWRKATGRKIHVRLEDSLMSSDGSNSENPETLASVLAKMKEQGSDNRGYADILRQVWQALQEQNTGNWDGVRNELVEILREEVPQ